jgi:hypothetical protein
VRLALLFAAACLSMTGCATIKSWFSPAVPVVQAEQPDEPPQLTTRPPAPVAPRTAPPAPAAPRAPAPAVPRPPAPAAPPPAPDTPPPVLSPVLSAVDEQRMRAETQQRIEGVELRLRQIDPAKLGSGQQDSLRTVQSFLDKAREAVQAQDIQRAYTLADKALLLADELTRHPR